ncbi:Bax inhibitor-1/YccA family protein [Agaribacterium haliotis]|uniref:Bax inhibitor-1/YccA family protein n=1 Tax=Agaribacterium haliotis TaxID=2013869 RepID=UPI000BB5671B|nr:Bax inhibitor-1/YccA family protein [Agaribacterium haliotis]
MQDVTGYSQSSTRPVEVTKVLRNTYTLLALTLATSAIAAGVSLAAGVGHGMGMVFSLIALGLIWFVLPRTARSSAGIAVVFAFTTCLGAGLGPVLGHYLAAYSNGSALIMQSLGLTAIVFFGLSGYVLTTGKDFSFMGGFLMAGLIVAIVASLGAFIASLFGVAISGVFLAISVMVALLMAGFILYDTSRIVNGGETNYIMATTALYLDIYNLFTSLLHILGAFSGDD